MIQPITLIQVGQMMVEDYGLDVDGAVREAEKLVKRLEARGMQVIKGDWVIPEVIVVERTAPVVTPPTQDDRWMNLANKVTHDTVGREPWKAVELR